MTIGPRVQGTEAERDAAAFLAAEFTSAGYMVELQPVPLESQRVAEQAFSVDGVPIDAQAFDGSGAGGVRGPLVVVPGLGAASDFAQVDVEGAVALIERGVLFFRDKIANAEAAVGELAHALLGCLASSADALAAPDCVLGAE